MLNLLWMYTSERILMIQPRQIKSEKVKIIGRTGTS